MEKNSKSVLLRKLLENIQDNLEQVRKIVADDTSGEAVESLDFSDLVLEKSTGTDGERGRIIEGVFDGQNMVGPDGKQYSVPPNYASKSKLVEGDILKLTIAGDGTFVYKQIQPIDRERLMGSLVKDKESDDFKALVEKKLYRLLLASVTYFRGDVGDKVVILVPKGGKSTWAAVENIIKN